jgi:AcrR family transcriptional regulator
MLGQSMQPSRRDVPIPQQDRSRRAAERIVEAARELLQTCDFSEVSLAQIADAADVSQGTLYARFRTKCALLHHLHEDHCTRTREELSAAGAWIDRTPSTEEKLRVGVRLFVAHLFENRQRVRNFRRAGLDDPGFLTRQARFDQEQQARITRLVCDCFPEEERTPALRRRARRSLRMVVAVVRDVIDTGIEIDDPADGPPESLADAVSDLALRCIGLPED